MTKEINKKRKCGQSGQGQNGPFLFWIVSFAHYIQILIFSGEF